MKNLIILLSFLLPLSAYSQDQLKLVESSAREEHPGIPQSPIIYTVSYIFIAQEDGITIEAVKSDNIYETVIDSRVINKGDSLLLQYVSYTFQSGSSMEESNSEDPYFMEGENGITSLVFVDYNYDRIKMTSSFPVYHFKGEKYSFDLPVVEDVERIYYP